MQRLFRSILVLLIALAAAGCSDDITCPDPDDQPTKPFIRSQVRQTDGPSPRTLATLTVGGDPVTSLLAASINYREFGEPEFLDDPLILAAIEEDAVVWQPGTPCTLRVVTDMGFARGSAVVPEAAAPVAPPSITLGDSLRVAWGPAQDADYYIVRAVVRADGDSLVLENAVTDTEAVFAADAVTLAGSLEGVVRAVSGPIPETGSDGNITEEGWGFFSMSFEDASSSFELIVEDPDARGLRPPAAAYGRQRARPVR